MSAAGVSGALGAAVLYGGSLALMKALSLLMLPLLTRALTLEEMGRLEILSTLMALGSTLVGFGLQPLLFRVGGEAAAGEARRRVAAGTYGLALGATALTLLAGLPLAPLLAAVLPGECGAGEVAAAVAVMSLEAAIAVPLAWLRMRDRVAAFCALTLGRVALQAALVATAAYTGAGVAGVLAGTATAACLQTALLGYLHIADAGLRRDRELVRLAGTYAMPVVGAGLLAFALAGLDRWLLATLEGTETVAAYGVAARFALAAVLLMQPFSMWWTPRRFTVLFGEDGVRRAARVITAALCLLCVVVLASAAAGPLLMGWLLPGTYAGAERLLLWLLFAMAFKEAAELLSIGCLAGRSSRRLLRAELLSALIAVLTAVPLVTTHGAEGAACAVLIAQATRLCLVVRFGSAVRPLPLPAASLAATAAVTAALAIAMQQLSAPWWRIAFAAAAMAGVAIAAVRLIPLPAPSLAARRPGAVGPEVQT